MPSTTTALTAAGETYFADLGRVRASGGATGERSSYGPLATLLNAVGATLAPKVFCVGELADQGAGHPDFGLYAAKQVQQGRPREAQAPERGVVEVKAAGDDAWLTAAGDQVSRYWGRYLVLVLGRGPALGGSAARRWRAAPPRVGALWPHTRRVRTARSMVGWPACPGPVFARRDRMSRRYAWLRRAVGSRSRIGNPGAAGGWSGPCARPPRAPSGSCASSGLMDHLFD